MNIKRFILAGLGGTVTMFVVGGVQGFLFELPALANYPQLSGVDMSNPFKMLSLGRSRCSRAFLICPALRLSLRANPWPN